MVSKFFGLFFFYADVLVILEEKPVGQHVQLTKCIPDGKKTTNHTLNCSAKH